MQLSILLGHLYKVPISWLERFTRLRSWWIHLCWICSLASMIVAWPDWGDELDRFWKLREQQMEAPFKPRELAVSSHESKKSFRLFMPTVAYLTGIRMKGIIALQYAMGFAFFGLLARLIADLTRDRVVATLVTLGIAFTYVGNCFFYDIGGWYDPPGMFFLLLALCSRRFIGIFLSTFFAGWCDERAFIATLIVLLFHQLRENGLGQPLRLRGLFRPTKAMLAIALSVALVLMGRWMLERYLGLSIPTGEGSGIGLGVLRHNFGHLPMALFSAFEFFWMPILLALLLMAANRQYLGALGMAVGVLGMTAISLVVYDVTRSAAYGFPSIVMALLVLGSRNDDPRILRGLSLLVMVLCLLFANHFVMFNSTWISPILPKALH